MMLARAFADERLCDSPTPSLTDCAFVIVDAILVNDSLTLDDVDATLDISAIVFSFSICRFFSLRTRAIWKDFFGHPRPDSETVLRSFQCMTKTWEREDTRSNLMSAGSAVFFDCAALESGAEYERLKLPNGGAFIQMYRKRKRG